MDQTKKIRIKMDFINVLLSLIKLKKLGQILNLKIMRKIKNGDLEELLKNQKIKINIEFILYIKM